MKQHAIASSSFLQLCSTLFSEADYPREFISPCSSYALSIVLIGVGDGPWEDMRKFDDKIPKREFDNFQVTSHSQLQFSSISTHPLAFDLDLLSAKFVNFTEIMKRDSSESAKEAAFALAALMEIPFQYQAATELGLLGYSLHCLFDIILQETEHNYCLSVFLS